jgi:hypothetical protein
MLTSCLLNNIFDYRKSFIDLKFRLFDKMNKLKVYIKGAPASAPFLEIIIADSFLMRFAGLMFRKKLPAATGLLLAPCNSVHMCFMRFSIDVVYLDKEYNIIQVVKNLKPWVGLSMCAKAWAVLEMTAGEAERCGFETGKRLVEKKD